MHAAVERLIGHGTGRVLELDHKPFRGFQLKTPCTWTDVIAEAFPDSHIVKVGNPDTVRDESKNDGRTKNVGTRERLSLIAGPVRGLLLRDPGIEALG